MLSLIGRISKASPTLPDVDSESALTIYLPTFLLPEHTPNASPSSAVWLSLLQHQLLKSRGKRQTQQFIYSLKGEPNNGWSLPIAIGEHSYLSGQHVNVLVDTGSANLAVADRIPCGKNSPFNSTRSQTLSTSDTKISVSYISSSWQGSLAEETIFLEDEQHIRTQLALFETEQGFCIDDAEWGGILGLGYLSLAQNHQKLFIDELTEQTDISNIITVQFCPVIYTANSNAFNGQGGTLWIGHPPLSLLGTVYYTPVIRQNFFEIQMLAVTVGNLLVTNNCNEIRRDRTIVDTGTTDTYLHNRLFEQVIAAFRSETERLGIPESFWYGDSKLAWPIHRLPELFRWLPIFKVTLQGMNGQSAFSLIATPDQYLREIYGSAEEQRQSNCYPHCSFLVFAIKKRQCGNVLGGMFLTGFFAVFDKNTNQVGFSESHCNGTMIDDRRIIQNESDEYPHSCKGESCQPWLTTVYGLTAGAAVFVSVSVLFTVILYGKCKFCSTAAIASCLKKVCSCFKSETIINSPLEDETSINEMVEIDISL